VRIDRLDLTAFGPFTGESLDLSGGAPGGIHVVFGLNEAGKSTALRAVLALFFGIPARTQDAHLHPYGKLRLGARLTHENRVLELTRLKRRKDDLLDGQGQPLDPARLAELIGHLDERTFTRRFGLDQSELELGAEALLGGGEEGLFAAGTAGAMARQVLDGLTADAEDLFLPRGKVPRLNRALNGFGEAQRLAKQLVRPPEKWLEQKRAQEAAEAEAEGLKQHRAGIRSEHARLSRLASLLSDLARLDHVETELAALAGVPRLGPDASRHREASQRQLRDAELSAQRFDEETARLRAQLGELPDPDPLSDVEDEHLSLRDRLARARSARQDLPKLVARQRAVQDAVARALQALGFEVADGEALARADTLLPSSAQEKRIQALIAERSGLDKELELARREVRDAVQERAETGPTSSDEPPRLDTLSAAVADAAAQRPALARAEEATERIAVHRTAIRAARRQLGLDDDADAPHEPLPTPGELRDTADRWQALEARRERLADEISQLDADVVTLRARLDTCRGHDELPSEEKLAEARARRDRLVVQVGLDGGPPALEIAAAIQAADEVVDGLRREAARLAEVRGLDQSLHAQDERRREKQRQFDQATTQLEEHRTQAVGRVSPSRRPPQTASAYRERGEALLALAARERELSEVGATRQALTEALCTAESRLRRVVVEVGATPIPEAVGLDGAIHFAAAQLDELRRRQERWREQHAHRERANRRVQSAEQNQEDVERRILEWERTFEQTARGLSVGARTVEQTRDALAELSQLRGILADAHQLTNRIEGIERDEHAFQEDIRRITARHAPDLADRDPIDAGERLLERIASSRRIAEERTRLSRALEEARTRLREAQSAVQAATARLADLMRDAGVDTASALREIEERSRHATRLDAERTELERSLLHRSSGRGLADLREEARGVSHHELSAKVDALTEELDTLDERIRDVEHDAVSYAEGLRRYGSEDVAWARQRAVVRGAEARSLLREYLVVRTAKVVLDQQVARYADRFAGPIARRASELFARLTRGAYSRLSIGVGERTIRLVRGSDEVEVGQLSRGTRAQLYLALRLASLETHFEKHHAVPLVLDDLFVDFDDERTLAAFEILGDLGRKLQILYFTHLGRDVEAARRGVPQELLFEHGI
jgi:uncharacterized protein YhaN